MCDPRIAEQVAYWFFRLNCCFTNVNFVVHPDESGAQETEADVLAVRFPHRCELITADNVLEDHAVFKNSPGLDLVIAEAKCGPCSINRKWLEADFDSINRTLYAMGVFPPCRVPAVSDSLYEASIYEDNVHRVRLFAVGRESDPKLPENVVQLTWDDVLTFIFERFSENDKYKSQHDQWDWIGRILYKLAQKSGDPDDYGHRVKARIGLQ